MEETHLWHHKLQRPCFLPSNPCQTQRVLFWVELLLKNSVSKSFITDSNSTHIHLKLQREQQEPRGKVKLTWFDQQETKTHETNPSPLKKWTPSSHMINLSLYGFFLSTKRTLRRKPAKIKRRECKVYEKRLPLTLMTNSWVILPIELLASHE